MRKNPVIITGLIIILLIAGAVLVWKQKPPVDTPPVVPPTTTPPTTMPPISQVPADWKTYGNKEFGFAFDYPGEWAVEEFRTTKGEETPYAFYEIRLWAPDQFDDKKRIDSKYLNDHFADPRILIYADAKGVRNKEEKFEKRIKENIAAYEQYGEIVKVINLPSGIKGYLIEKATSEELLIISLNEIMITFNSGLGVPLRMDIVRTFRS